MGISSKRCGNANLVSIIANLHQDMGNQKNIRIYHLKLFLGSFKPRVKI